jgi:glycosyltransferase involved in cell wall biosynthesis
MKPEDYHPSMKPLEEGCRLAGWACIPLPLVGGKLAILLRHVALVSKVWKCREPRIVVREFSTLPLLLVFPFLWPKRKTLFFVVHHNLQWAARERLEAFGLKVLSALGARWMLFETQDFQGLEKYSIPSESNVVVPHPISEKGSKHWKKQDRPVVGVAGYYRPEKGMDELLGLLTRALPEMDVLLGVPNPEAVRHLDAEVVNTSTDEAYRNMISRCDVLVFNNRADSYFYRASGPIADATVCGTAVVAPAFPIIGKQVEGVGEVFQTLEELPDAVRTAVEKQASGEYKFAAVCAARSAAAIAEILKAVEHG